MPKQIQMHVWPLANSEIVLRALEILYFFDPGLWLTSIIIQQDKNNIRRDPSFPWRHGFSPSPPRVRVCIQLLLLKSSNLKRNYQTL